MDPFLGAIIAVLGIAVGIFSAHATLGRQIARALTLIERAVSDITVLQVDVKSIQAARLHFHRRYNDDSAQGTLDDT